jgi:hypothetical protein
VSDETTVFIKEDLPSSTFHGVKRFWMAEDVLHNVNELTHGSFLHLLFIFIVHYSSGKIQQKYM